jgi:hypothetical protein
LSGGLWSLGSFAQSELGRAEVVGVEQWAEVQRLLDGDPDLPGVRVGELLEPLGWDGGKTILDDYLREVRPLFQRAKTTQRTIYAPGEICQFDVWEPDLESPARRRSPGTAPFPKHKPTRATLAGGLQRTQSLRCGSGRLRSRRTRRRF